MNMHSLRNPNEEMKWIDISEKTLDRNDYLSGTISAEEAVKRILTAMEHRNGREGEGGAVRIRVREDDTGMVRIEGDIDRKSISFRTGMPVFRTVRSSVA
jgi:hypothetical protein